jgi:predicted nucleotidyltransferase
MRKQETIQDKILKEIDSIVNQIVSRYRPLRIILFGSAAKGDFENANDLDFLIIKDDVPYYGIDRMRELEDIIERETAADMLVYRSDEIDERMALGDPFILSIIKEGQVLYG